MRKTVLKLLTVRVRVQLKCNNAKSKAGNDVITAYNTPSGLDLHSCQT